MKRRNFIKASAWGSAGIISQPDLVFSKTKPNKVLIIGAGLAELTATYRLKQNNIACTVLEAQNRIGGRILTHTIDEGLTVELGAEWIGESHTKIKNLCQELGLKLSNHQFDTALYVGQKYAQANTWSFHPEWEVKYKKILQDFLKTNKAQQKELDKLDWWRFLLKSGINEQDLEILELNNSTDFGESIRAVSAYYALNEYAQSSPKNEMDYKIIGGNEQIINVLKDKIGTENIKTNHKITNINQQNQKTIITCQNGSRWEADKVICTLPVSALLEVNFEPNLPIIKKTALESLQYARIIKTAVLFKERFWQMENFDLLTDTLGHYYFHSTKNQNHTKSCLTSYSIGDKAQLIARMSQTQKIKAICEPLEGIFGKVEHLVEKVVSYYWGDDKSSRGAYALYKINQCFELREEIQKKFKNIHFAGEHLAEWQGFMEGAIETGEKAVNDLG